MVVAAALCTSLGARAAPEAPAEGPSADAIMKLLQDKGLVDKAALDKGLLNATRETPLVQSVRDAASDLVITAMNFIGVRYRLGGTTEETGFDCSGFTRHIFERSIGLLLPRRADEQASAPGLLRIDQQDLRPGDLVFFNTLRRTFSHVGIYIGDGKFIHSPRSGSTVRIEDMRMAYWQQRFNGARRVPQVQATGEVSRTP